MSAIKIKLKENKTPLLHVIDVFFRDKREFYWDSTEINKTNKKVLLRERKRHTA